MRAIARSLLYPAARTILLLGLGIVLADPAKYVPVAASVDLRFFATAVLVVGFFLLLSDLALLLEHPAGLQALVRIMSHPPTPRRTATAAQAAHRLFRACAGLTIVFVALELPPQLGHVAVSATLVGSDAMLPSWLAVFHGAAWIATGLLSVWLLTSFAGVRWPLLARAVPVPVPANVLAMTVAYVALAGRGVLAETIKFHSPALLFGILAALEAVQMAYSFRSARTFLRESGSYRVVKGANLARWLTVAARMSLVGAGGLVLWSLLEIVPNLGVAALNPLFTTRYAVVGAEVALLTVATTDSELRSPRWKTWALTVQVVALAGLAVLVWIASSAFGSLNGFALLVGAVTSTAVMCTAIARAFLLISPFGPSALREPADWLNRSYFRPFALAASLTFYGMYVRPALYRSTSYASIYEWIPVPLVFSVVFLAWMRTREFRPVPLVVPASESETWQTHHQLREERPDDQFTTILTSEAGFIGTKRWEPVATHLLGGLIRTNARLDDVVAAIRILVNHRDPRTWWQLIPWWWTIPGLRRSEQRKTRESRIVSLQRAAERAMESSPVRGNHREPLNLGTTEIRRAAFTFIDSGGDPLPLIVALAIVEWQRGNRSSPFRWNWVLNYRNPPPGLIERWWRRHHYLERIRRERTLTVEEAIRQVTEEQAESSDELVSTAHDAR